MTGAELIAFERQRQITEEGWTYEHDRNHTQAELVRAAMCYADRAGLQIISSQGGDQLRMRPSWPWDMRSWKPKSNPLDNLVKAGALIAAEIDRLQDR